MWSMAVHFTYEWGDRDQFFSIFQQCDSYYACLWSVIAYTRPDTFIICSLALIAGIRLYIALLKYVIGVTFQAACDFYDSVLALADTLGKFIDILRRRGPNQ